MTERLRGRAGVAQRKRRLYAEPLCRDCKAKGITTVSVTIDHIKPMAMGGADTDDNCQALCQDCHDIKTAYESASSEAASFHPDWLGPSAVPLSILCGPPCSGKTTYIREREQPGDIVIDLDTIMMTIDPSYKHWSNSIYPALLHKAVRVRNSLLGSLNRRTEGSAWFIVAAPTEAERDWWQGQLGGEIILLDPGMGECKGRADKRGTPLAREGIDRWYRSAKAPWQRKESAPKKQAIGVDGGPIE